MKSIIFWDLTACSPSSLPPACLLVFAELISSTLKMEAICFSETSVETRRTTRRQILEDDTLSLDGKARNLFYICPLLTAESSFRHPMLSGLC
jgi:hypothetical protein